MNYNTQDWYLKVEKLAKLKTQSKPVWVASTYGAILPLKSMVLFMMCGWSTGAGKAQSEDGARPSDGSERVLVIFLLM